MNLYALAADLVLLLHLAYLGFTVGGEGAIILGGIFHWAWVRNRLFRILHLAAVIFVAFEAVIGMWCPLTVWEYRLRTLAGQQVEDQLSFLARLIQSLLYYDFPPWFFLSLYLGFALLVVVTFIFVPLNRRR